MKVPFIKELCELIGVATLCFLVIGIPGLRGDIPPLEASLFAGAVVMLIIYGVGEISGAHINPAVSFGFLVWGKFSTQQFFRYLAAQILGGILALILLIIALGRDFDWNAAAPRLASPIAFGVEAFLTGFLIFIILSVATGDCRICPDTRPLAGMIVGGAIATLSYFGGSLGVGVLNPVVLLVFAILAGSWLELIMFTGAAIVGAIVAALFYKLTRSQFVVQQAQTSKS
jgi:glycerol uptake facilitator-like aquaporin